MCDASQTSNQFRINVELQQAKHLGVAILLHHINSLVLLDKIVHLAGERIGPQPQVIRFSFIFFTQLIAAIRSGPNAKFRSERPFRFPEPAVAPCETSGRGTKDRAVSNLRFSRSILFS